MPHLLVLGEREAVAWVLTAQRMAFPGYRAREVGELSAGDELFLYTTRGCFHNPTRHRGRVIGTARAETPVSALAEPVSVAGREFSLGCDIRLEGLAPCGLGIELAPLVPRLRSFPNKKGWSVRLRRPLLTLVPPDADVLRSKLAAVTGPPDDALDSYLSAVPGYAPGITKS